MQANTYSADWFSIFMDTISPEQTQREIEFVDTFLPRSSRVLDVACGTGRHARLLAARGHRLIAVDRDPAVLATDRSSSLAWVCADMRHLPLRAACADAIICLWQSFGYFQADDNLALLRDWTSLVTPGGLLILDLYNRSHFEANQGERAFIRAGEPIRERRRMSGDRLIVELSYNTRRGTDRFAWQLFTPSQLAELAAGQGWQLVAACSEFQRDLPPDPERPRVQYVFRQTEQGRGVESAYPLRSRSEWW